MSSGDLVSRKYGSFRGADFRGDEVNIVRSPDCLNVWKDYREIESIRTRPGMVMVDKFTEPVWGIFFYQVGNTLMQLVHSGTKLYRIEQTNGVSERTEIYQGLNPRKSEAFIYNNIWYFKDGINYLQYDGETVGEVTGYIPTTSIGRKPAGGGTQYEDVNLLTGLRKNTFLADGESKEFYLDVQEIDADFQPIVKVNDEILAYTAYEVVSAAGKIILQEAPPEPLTDGQDNVCITFRKTVPGYRDRINHCTLLQVFDNRVFFSGNPDYPNVLFHCSLNDPSYCSDLDYYNEGLDLAPITSLVAGNNALWVFKEPSQANTAVFYHNPTIDSEYGKIYPSTHSSISTGCVGAAINFNDDIVFFSERGMEGINGDVTTEQVIAHRSSLVDRKLLAEDRSSYEHILLEEWEGYLLCFVENKVYLADSRAMFTNENHPEYEWFYWELEENITSTRVHKGTLYLGTEHGICTLRDYDAHLAENISVESYWTTPKDLFQNPQYQKTTNKKGCVVEATGDVSVQVRTDKDDWEEVGTFENVTDYFTCRIKKKKFKDIQLRFCSDTRFSLETATLECYVGGYIKR